VKYVWISKYRDSFPVAVMCHVLHVSTSGYYASLDRTPSGRALRHERIQQAVQQVHAESFGIYGSRKIAEMLEERDDLESGCRNTVATAMRELGLASNVVKAFKPTTTQADPTKQPAENKLAQDFTADAPNRKWVTDNGFGCCDWRIFRQGSRGWNTGLRLSPASCFALASGQWISPIANNRDTRRGLPTRTGHQILPNQGRRPTLRLGIAVQAAPRPTGEHNLGRTVLRRRQAPHRSLG
jgi:hypothetical protein